MQPRWGFCLKNLFWMLISYHYSEISCSCANHLLWVYEIASDTWSVFRNSCFSAYPLLWVYEIASLVCVLGWRCGYTISIAWGQTKFGSWETYLAMPRSVLKFNSVSKLKKYLLTFTPGFNSTSQNCRVHVIEVLTLGKHYFTTEKDSITWCTTQILDLI